MLDPKKMFLALILATTPFLQAQSENKQTSATIAAIPVTNENRQNIVKLINNIYDSEGCGICQKPGAEIFWFSSYSRCAHLTCFTLIKPAQKELIPLLEAIFKNRDNFGDFNKTHVAVIEHIYAQIRKNGFATIKEYIERHGINALQKLFDSEECRLVIFNYAVKSCLKKIRA